MDKNAIKKYAVWARRELISRVSQRAAFYEITDKGYGDASAESVLGRVMSAEEKRQRQALIAQIREKGYEQVMEEIAYTWFNRFIALRFMEVNDYLPTRVRVFTDDENNFKPQILAEAINMNLDGLDMEKVYALKNANNDDALFKYMIIVQCNALSSILPGMFQRISDFTELLFPDNLLREGSLIEQMVSMIPEEDWTDQVQIIGWLYQYYNTEPKDKVFADLKKNIKISKESIPAATQLFTPDWIVRYMVENSLGRLWLEGHPNDELKASWKYYLDEAVQESDVQVQLSEIRKEYAVLKPENILAIDPCQGSGHILAYMFDVLVQIYESYGYTAREAVASIVEHNIWGLDIDERATQLSYFSVMMKARQYDRRFFRRGIQPNVYTIVESNDIDSHCIEYFVNGKAELRIALDSLVKELHDAKEYGSIINVTHVDFEKLYERLVEIQNEDNPTIYSDQITKTVTQLIRIGQVLANTYHVVVTNPPYMGSGNMGSQLTDYLKREYPNSKSDLSTVFMERALRFTKKNGFISMINIPVWMFISSYEMLRKLLLNSSTIVNMMHPGRGIFGSDFGTVAFTLCKVTGMDYTGTYARLFDEQVEVKSSEMREEQFLSGKGRFSNKQSSYRIIPGNPIAYWASRAIISDFERGDQIGSFSTVAEGIKTGDNDTYLRLWTEVSADKFSFAQTKTGKKWYPHNKGGDYRKWYGNLNWVINWENDGYEIKNSKNSGLQGKSMYFSEYASWSKIGLRGKVLRYYKENILFDSGAPAMSNSRIKQCLALFNSSVGRELLLIISPTLNLQVGEVKSIPLICNSDVEGLVDLCISAEKDDWDETETSWDFTKSPLLGFHLIADAYLAYKRKCEERFTAVQQAEEKINDILIQSYCLEGQVPSKVPDRDITIWRVFDNPQEIPSSMETSAYVRTKKDLVVQLISYAVGCMFGRYSLDKQGLVYAGGVWESSNYLSYPADKDNIIPICDDEYFEDDITGRFVKWVELVYGKNTLEDNLSFISEALGGKGTAREVIRNYFLNDFFADHCKLYAVTGSGKRPIYWQFDSGKKNGFKCLIYMHRYKPDTLARIRTDYVHEQQSRYRTAIADLEIRIANAETSERVKLAKQLNKLQEQAEELRVYEEKIHHLADQMINIDLDDGVKHNYAIFQDVLAKIK